MAPNEYRKMPKPLPLLVKRNVFNPYYLGLMEKKVKEDLTKNITVSIQVVPAHKFIGVRYLGASDYMDFWKKDEAKYHRDRCDEVDGFLSSIKNFNGIVGAWYSENGKKGYMYGIEVPPGYNGEIPEGMECVAFLESTYAVFHHPPYDFATMELSIHKALWQSMESWKPAEHGYRWRDDLPIYQRHNPPKWGQAFLKPMKKLK